ncbi:MAG: radical SAM protein [Thermodesulfobacteriota bacterium]|nr:radical SAM protein [Thermodesulfobacteriota bacterium]
MNNITRIKIELLCYGVRLSQDTLKRFPGYRYKRASLSEGVCFNLYSQSGSIIPINVAVHEAFVKKSPFYFNQAEGVIYKKEKPYVSAAVIDHPSWYSRRLADGTYFEEVFQCHYDTILASSLTNFCDLKQKGDGCKFCALGNDMSRQHYKNPEHIIQVLEKLQSLGISYREVNLNSGTLVDEEKGFSIFLKAIRAIRSVTKVPIYAQICPPQKKYLLDDLRNAGLTTISLNLEIYDQERRMKIMPAKSHHEREYYFEVLKYAIDLFGPNQVSSWLIAGLEPPESTISGLYRIAQIGAIPFVTVFRPLKGSELADKSPPNPKSIFPIFKALRDVLNETGLNPCASKGGCVLCNCCNLLT